MSRISSVPWVLKSDFGMGNETYCEVEGVGSRSAFEKGIMPSQCCSPGSIFVLGCDLHEGRIGIE